MDFLGNEILIILFRLSIIAVHSGEHCGPWASDFVKPICLSVTYRLQNHQLHGNKYSVVAHGLLVLLSLSVFLLLTDYKTSSYMETNIEPMDNSATPIGKHSQLLARPRDDDRNNLAARDLRSDRSATPEATDWLSCIARKSGLPRLLLSWLLLMCAVVMIWLCLSAAVTSPDHKTITEPQVS